MCETCGCSEGAETKIVNLETCKTRDPASNHHDDSHHHAHLHDDGHFHDHVHDHDHSHSHASTVLLERDVLAKNTALAARNRAWFAGREILALNLVSGPGAGKTTLLERTVRELRHTLTIFVIEGDQARPMTACESGPPASPWSRSIQAAVSFGCRHGRARPRRVETIIRFSPHGRECRQSRLSSHVRSRRSAKVAILSVTEGMISRSNTRTCSRPLACSLSTRLVFCLMSNSTSTAARTMHGRSIRRSRS